ncbi:MAG: hypothetical protein ACKVU4_15240 [Phycisphaerales bacterium]
MTATLRIEVRPTGPGDLDAVTALLSERDGRALELAHVSAALFGLDPAHLAGWIASVGGKPAGFTSLYVRDQRWGDRTIRAGYWAHLFVREACRRFMVYPQLVLAMMRGIKPLGIDAIFTGTRRPHVAQGHEKLGFARVGGLRVMFKPLRPFRLLARYKGWPGVLRAAAVPGDAAYGAWLKLRRGGSDAALAIREMDAGEHAMEMIPTLLNASGEGRVSQVWTPETLRRRLAGTIDGERYTVLAADRGGEVVAALVYRLASRERVRVGIIMEVVNARTERRAAPALLAEAERRMRGEGADTTLYLDGLGSAAADLLRSSGHRVASGETYQMLVWPKTLAPRDSVAADLANWRFSFLDHDAF